MTRFSLRSLAAAMIVMSGAVAIPQPAWPADLHLKPKPVVRQESDWRTRLFEEFKRYLQRQNH